MQIAPVFPLWLPLTTHHEPCKFKCTLHSLHCTDTVKWFRPGSHGQLYFNPEVPPYSHRRMLFVCQHVGDRHVGV